MPLTHSQATRSLTGTLGSLVMRGLLAGLFAGVLAGGVAFTTGETAIDQAIAIEEGSAPTDEHTHADSSAHQDDHSDEPLVSRNGQRAGLFLATAVGGAAIGAVFGVAVGFARRYSGRPASGLIGITSASGWFAFAAVPFLLYPANPPAVGDPDTIELRTLLWAAAILLGVASVAAGFVVHRKLRTSSWATVKAVAPVLAALAVVGMGYSVLPGIDEVPDDFPASLLWNFRMSSLATQLTLWSALAVTYSYLTERTQQQRH